jgi:hypothetical protein
LSARRHPIKTGEYVAHQLWPAFFQSRTPHPSIPGEGRVCLCIGVASPAGMIVEAGQAVVRRPQRCRSHGCLRRLGRRGRRIATACTQRATERETPKQPAGADHVWVTSPSPQELTRNTQTGS